MEKIDQLNPQSYPFILRGYFFSMGQNERFSFLYILIVKEKIMRKEIELKGSIYTAKSLAEGMGVSTRLIHYFRNVGKLKSITSGKARFYFLKEDVEEFLKEKGYE